MKKSAMLQAFRALGRKPLLFLLILPISFSSVLYVCFMPNMTKLLDLNSLANGMDYYPVQLVAEEIRSLIVGSFASLLALAGIFLLLPPAVELLRDGAAGAGTPQGWFARGIVNHWWKPITTGALTGAAYFIVSLPVIVVMAVSLIMNTITGSINTDIMNAPNLSPADALNGAMGGLMPAMLRQLAIYGAIIGIIALVVYSLFGLMLPALADRKFGAAFRLMFGRKGFRNLPRMAGGLFLLYIIPEAIFVGLGALYLVSVGMPKDYLGWMTALLSFFKSWEGILGLVISAFFPMITYAFKFCVYQQIKEEEAGPPVLQV